MSDRHPDDFRRFAWARLRFPRPAIRSLRACSHSIDRRIFRFFRALVRRIGHAKHRVVRLFLRPESAEPFPRWLVRPACPRPEGREGRTATEGRHQRADHEVQKERGQESPADLAQLLSSFDRIIRRSANHESISAVVFIIPWGTSPAGPCTVVRLTARAACSQNQSTELTSAHPEDK